MLSVFRSLNFWKSVSIILMGLVIALGLRLMGVHRPSRHHLPDVIEKLKLNEDQSQALRKIFRDNREEHEKLREKVKHLDLELQSAMNNEQASIDEIRGKFQSVDQLKKEMAEQRFNMTLEIRKIVGAQNMESFRRMRGPGQNKRGKMGPHHKPPRGH